MTQLIINLELTGFDKSDLGVIGESRSMPSSRRNSGNQNGSMSPYPPINRNHSACTLTGNYNMPNTQSGTQTFGLAMPGQITGLHPAMATSAGSSLSTGQLTVTRHASISTGGLSDTQNTYHSSQTTVPGQNGGLHVPSMSGVTGDQLTAAHSSSAIYGANLMPDQNNNNNIVRRKSSTALGSVARFNRAMSLRANSEPSENESTLHPTRNSYSAAVPQPLANGAMERFGGGGKSSLVSGTGGDNLATGSPRAGRTNRAGQRLSVGIGAGTGGSSELAIRRKPKPPSISANSCSSSDDLSSDDEQRSGADGTGGRQSDDQCGSGKIVGEIKLGFVMTKGLLEIEIISARRLILNQCKTAPGELNNPCFQLALLKMY